MSKHEQIENIILNMIKQQLLLPGDAITPIREMASMHDMSVTPVIEAYHNLEKRGILIARPRSKFIVAPYSEAIEENEVNDRSLHNQTDRYSSLNSIHYAITDGTVRFPFALQECLVRVEDNEKMLNRFSRNMKQEISPPQLQRFDRPNSNLKSALCKWMYSYNCAVEPEDTIITNGSTFGALSLILHCCVPQGSAVGVAEPGDMQHYLAIKANDLTPVVIHSNPGSGLDLDSLEQAIQNHPEMRSIIISCNNDVPTGSLMSDNSKRRLAAICRSNGITIIEDDRYGSLSYESLNTGFRPSPLIKFASDITVYLGYINYTGAQSMGIHWVCSHKYSSELHYFSKAMALQPAAVMQSGYLVTATSLSTARRKAACESHRQTMERVRKEIYESFPVGVSVYRPAGGWFLWVKLPNNCDSIKLLEKAYERGITFVPGTLYTKNGSYTDHICLNFTVADTCPDWKEGISELGRLVKELTENN